MVCGYVLELFTLVLFVSGGALYIYTLVDFSQNNCLGDISNITIASDVFSVWKVFEEDPDIPIGALVVSLSSTCIWICILYVLPVQTVIAGAGIAVSGLITAGVYLATQESVLIDAVEELRIVGWVLVAIAIIGGAAVLFNYERIKRAANNLHAGIESIYKSLCGVMIGTIVLQAAFVALLVSYWHALASFGTHTFHCFDTSLLRWSHIMFTLFYLGWALAVLRMTKLVLVVYLIDRKQHDNLQMQLRERFTGDQKIKFLGQGETTVACELVQASGAIVLGSAIIALLEEAARRHAYLTRPSKSNIFGSGRTYQFCNSACLIFAIPSAILYSCVSLFSIGAEVMSRFTLLIVAISPREYTFCGAGAVMRQILAVSPSMLLGTIVDDMIPFVVTSAFTYALSLGVGISTWALLDSRHDWGSVLDEYSVHPIVVIIAVIAYGILLRFSTLTILVVIILNDFLSSVQSVHAPLASLLVACACKLCMDFLVSAVIYATEYIYFKHALSTAVLHRIDKRRRSNDYSPLTRG